MNPLNLAKTALSFGVSIGAGAVVGNAIKTSIPSNSKLLQKISIATGGFVLSSMVGEMASKYTIHNLDTTLNAFKQAKTAADESSQSDS